MLHKAFNLFTDNFSVCVFFSLLTHHASLSTTNKRLCVCLGISITPPPPPSMPPPLLPPSLLLVFALLLHPLPPCLCVRACTYCRLALDDAIRHERQLNISRFSPRVAGESDFLQTVINKVITAKEVNHKGQGEKAESEEVEFVLRILVELLSNIRTLICPSPQKKSFNVLMKTIKRHSCYSETLLQVEIWPQKSFVLVVFSSLYFSTYVRHFYSTFRDFVCFCVCCL